MQRVGTNRNPALDKFGTGKHGFTAGNPQTGTPATTPGYELFDSWQEELCSVIEGMGFTLDSNKRDQLLTAIQAMQRGKAMVNVAGGATVTLTAAQYNLPILILTGALTANINLIFPAISGAWIVRNQTTGNFTVTCKTQSGSGVVVSQGFSNALFGDGDNLYAEQTDWASLQTQTATAFTSAGVAPNFKLEPSPALAVYAAGQRFRVKFSAAVSGSATLNVSGLGAKSIKQYDSAGNKVAPVIVANQLADVEYDGVDWVILDPLPAALPANVAKTDAVQAFSKAQRGAVVALTDAATIAVDLSLANNFSLTLAGNRTLGTPTNAAAGQSGIIAVTQDASGSRTLAFGSGWKFAGGTAPALSTAAGAVDYLAYYVEGPSRVYVSAVKDVR